MAFSELKMHLERHHAETDPKFQKSAFPNRFPTTLTSVQSAAVDGAKKVS